jgi:hypothetical protein
VFANVATIPSDAFWFSATFTAITRVQIPSGTPNRISCLRRSSPDIRRCKKPHFCVPFAPPNLQCYAVPTTGSSSRPVIGKSKANTAASGQFWRNTSQPMMLGQLCRSIPALELVIADPAVLVAHACLGDSGPRGAFRVPMLGHCLPGSAGDSGLLRGQPLTPAIRRMRLRIRNFTSNSRPAFARP